MQKENFKTRVSMDDLRRESAEDRLQKTLEDLSDATFQHVKGMLGQLQGDLSSSIGGVSESVVKGLRDIKQELNVAESVRQRPWPWVGGAAVFGGAIGALAQSNRRTAVPVTYRASDTSMNAHANVAETATGTRWLLVLAEIGLTLLQAKMAGAHAASKTEVAESMH